MGYTISADSKKTLTWDDNPSGENSYAVISNGSIESLSVPGVGGASVVYTTDVDMLTHLKTVIEQLLGELSQY